MPPAFWSINPSRCSGWSFHGGNAEVGVARRNDRLECCFTTLPDQFALGTMSAHKTASEKPRTYLRQVNAHWSKEGRIKRAARGTYQKPLSKGEGIGRARADWRRCCIQTACETLTVIATGERKQQNFKGLGASCPLVSIRYTNELPRPASDT